MLLHFLFSRAVLSRLLTHVQLFATPWTAAFQAPLSMGFSRKEYWSGLPFPVLGDLSDTRVGLASPVSPALLGRFFTSSTTWKAPIISIDEDKAFDKIQHLSGLPWWLSDKEFT